MKKLFLTSKTALIALSFLIFASCSSEDDLPQIEVPTVSYTITTLDATFFQIGNSNAPTINWNGDVGSFSLSTPITGLTINATTGVLNWTKNLPIGTHNVEVVIANSAGQTTKNIILNNPLQGIFTGTYSSSNFFELEFNSDGTLVIRANNEIDPEIATGTWELDVETITVDYTYDDFNEDFSLSGTLEIGTTAIYSGDWYSGHGAISGNEGGVFEVILN